MWNFKTDSKEKKPSSQHRLKASVKKSLLKAPPSEKKELPAPATIDKDKDVYLKEVCLQFTPTIHILRTAIPNLLKLFCH